MKTGRDVRPQHYEFAHRAMPQVMFAHLDENLGYLVDAPQQFIDHLWGFVGKKVAERGQQPLAGPGPRIQRVALNPGVMWVIEMPPPEAMAEALYLAIVPLRPQGSPGERLAFYTLEFGNDLQTGAPYHVLCNWTAEGAHNNSGWTVEPTVPAFTQAVLAHLGIGPKPN